VKASTQMPETIRASATTRPSGDWGTMSP
jgi:hypothetical protein